MTPEELSAKVRQVEDGFTERKLKGNPSDVIETLVAFANSVPASREAVLYVGVKDDGTVVGVEGDPDKLQRDIHDWATKRCYPPIAVQCEAFFGTDGRTVVAVTLAASNQRPHFAGHAYVRAGSKTVKASREALDELIASRNTKAGAILRYKDAHPTDPVTVTIPWYDTAREEGFLLERECRIEGCSAHSVELFELSASRRYSVPLDFVILSADPIHLRSLRLRITEPGWLM